MRCKNCGGIMHHFLIAEGGKNFYYCSTGMTGFERMGYRKPHIYPCATVQNEQHQIVPIGTMLAYLSENKTYLFKVGN